MSSPIANFIQALKEQDDSGVVYSAAREDNVKVILPSKPAVKPRPKPPAEQPVKVKLKFGSVATKQSVKPEARQATKQVQQVSTQAQVVAKADELEEMFIKSETKESLKDAWVEQYNNAQKSKANNQVVNRIRSGKFKIEDDGNVSLLPDYDLYKKSSNDILNDKWLK